MKVYDFIKKIIQAETRHEKQWKKEHVGKYGRAIEPKKGEKLKPPDTTRNWQV
jgi:hypothetical protein